MTTTVRAGKAGDLEKLSYFIAVRFTTNKHTQHPPASHRHNASAALIAPYCTSQDLRPLTAVCSTDLHTLEASKLLLVHMVDKHELKSRENTDGRKETSVIRVCG